MYRLQREGIDALGRRLAEEQGYDAEEDAIAEESARRVRERLDEIGDELARDETWTDSVNSFLFLRCKYL